MIEHTSCHHGDVNKQNNLESALALIDVNSRGSALRPWSQRNIAFMEIDFFEDPAKDMAFFSGHDGPVEGNASLETFIKEIVINRPNGPVLWCDLKSRTNVSAVMSWDPDKHLDTARLFQTLERVVPSNSRYERRIVLSCQEPLVFSKIADLNHKVYQGRWRLAEDLPHFNHYIIPFTSLRWFVPSYFTRAYVQNYFLTGKHRFEPTADIVCLDRSFFDSQEEISLFIKLSGIEKNTTLILYNYTLDETPFKIDGYQIIFQYDYAL